jgi:serine/threonine protein kinase
VKVVLLLQPTLAEIVWRIQVSLIMVVTTLSRHALTLVRAPVWLAPEIMKKEEYTEKADVYSFGIIMWELVCRFKPFDEFEVAHSDFTSQLEDAIIGGLRPNFPDDSVPEYDALAADCWKGDPKLRPTFEEICKRLNEIAQHVRQYQSEDQTPTTSTEAIVVTPTGAPTPSA